MRYPGRGIVAVLVITVTGPAHAQLPGVPVPPLPEVPTPPKRLRAGDGADGGNAASGSGGGSTPNGAGGASGGVKGITATNPPANGAEDLTLPLIVVVLLAFGGLASGASAAGRWSDYVSARSPVSASPRISVWISLVPS